MLRKCILLLFVCNVIGGLGCRAFGQCAGHAVLNDYERGAFLAAAYGERKVIAVHLLAAQGCNHTLIDTLTNIRADVRFADEKVGYLLVMFPREKVLGVADLPGVAYASVAIADADYSNLYQKDPSFIPQAERKVAAFPPIAIPFPRVAKVLPKDGPYFAAAEAGLPALWRQHPEADGRGVRVAVFDRGVDLLHPALLLAKDRDGNAVPKIADIITLTTPEEDAGWVQFGDTVQTTGGAFVAAGHTWTAPHNGRFRFGIFQREIHLGTWFPGQNDPHVKALPISIGVLWDEQNNRVWVDTDGDGNFRNQRALGDYGETQDMDYFGRRDSEDDNRIPFGIKIDRARKAAYLSIADSPHGTMVAGPLGANQLTGGLFLGAAPNAQLIDARSPAPNYFMPLLLSTLARADVDVANWSGRLGVPELDGREDFFRHAVKRAISAYDKPVACYCAVANSLHVLDYQSPEMLRRNRQLSPPYAEVANGDVWFTASGLINTVLAPSTSLITQSRYMPFALTWEDGKLHINKALLVPPSPDGYLIGDNPSPAIPVVSGILADLITEARREHIRYNAMRLVQAVLTGSHLLPETPTSQQGFGLVDAAGAWNQLARMATADDPSNTILTWFSVARPENGGLKEIDGFQADFAQSTGTVDEELWITRHGGYPGGRAYDFNLRGDDGTYKLLDQKAILPRDKRVRVRFSVRVSSGLHVAFLQLFDAAAGADMAEVALAVRAPEVGEDIAPGVEKYQATIPPLHFDVRYIRLGEGTQAARFVMRIPSDNPPPISTRAMPGFVYGLDGTESSAIATIAGESLDSMHHIGPMQEFESLVAVQKPETIGIAWGNRDSPEYATPYDPPAPDASITGTVIVTKYALAIQRDGASVNLRNVLADIEGRAELYDAQLFTSETRGEGRHASVNIQRVLGAHISQWRVHVSSPLLVPNADAFLLNCTDPEKGCSVAAQQSLRKHGVTLVIDEPKEGLWRIVIRRRDRIDSPMPYRIHEAVLVQTATPVEITDHKHATGSTWSVVLAPKRSDAQYVAFRFTGSLGNEKKGPRIAVTPLTADYP